ncbi:MAG: phosphatase PAP2 family protein [candidate division Zixibacteria bacterium]|nr:phosphatase PAP2 family protein [candidate division Zixibacteria bacterium]
MILILHANLSGWWRFLLLHFGIASSILFVASIQWTSPAFKFFRHWYPFLLVTFLFWEAENFVHLIHPEWKNGWLIAADFKLLGGHPTVVLEKITNPYVTEFFEFIYFTYYFIPLFGLWIYLKQSERNFQTFAAHYLLALYLGYLIFPLVPAEGPWKTLAGHQTMLIEGKWIFRQLNDYLHHKGAITGGCFPSTHLSAATALLLSAARTDKKIFWGSVIWFALLFFSTVYGRYHYFVDGAAGLAIGAAAFLFSSVLVKRWYPKTTAFPTGGETR